MAELVVVDDVLVAEGDAEHPLADQGGQFVLDPLRRPCVAEAGCEALDQADGAIRSAEQQHTGIRGDRPAIKAGDHGAPSYGRKVE